MPSTLKNNRLPTALIQPNEDGRKIRHLRADEFPAGSKSPGRLSPVLADLHMHSTASDGWRDPDEVARLAADQRVRVMALTDHDTVIGIDRAREVAHRRGLGYVPALEVTTYPPNQMRHILAHGIDPRHPRLLAMIARTQAIYRRQTETWIELLLDQGIGRGLGLEAFRFKATLMPGAVLKVLLQHGVMSEREAWDGVRQATATLPSDFDAAFPSPAEAVGVIREAGGLAVHAHPGSVPDQTLMKEVLPLVDGLEVYTRRHRPDQIPVYESLAAEHGLVATVGTDYHGFNGDAYQAPKVVIDQRYLEQLGSRIEWPALEKAG
jgi:3',5'-nucleoside bisphosphate phosphatase